MTTKIIRTATKPDEQGVWQRKSDGEVINIVCWRGKLLLVESGSVAPLEAKDLMPNLYRLLEISNDDWSAEEPAYREPTAEDVGKEWEVRDNTSQEWRKAVGLAVLAEHLNNRFIMQSSADKSIWIYFNQARILAESKVEVSQPAESPAPQEKPREWFVNPTSGTHWGYAYERRDSAGDNPIHVREVTAADERLRGVTEEVEQLLRVSADSWRRTKPISEIMIDLANRLTVALEGR